jgi:hypothetical protein
MEKYILANIKTFCENLGAGPQDDLEAKGWGVGQNMADLCNYLTFDIMGDLCFGKAFGMLERPDNRFAIELIGSAAHRHLIVGFDPLHFSDSKLTVLKKVWNKPHDSPSPSRQGAFPQNCFGP